MQYGFPISDCVCDISCEVHRRVLYTVVLTRNMTFLFRTVFVKSSVIYAGLSYIH